jgi:hypothetical protein
LIEYDIRGNYDKIVARVHDWEEMLKSLFLSVLCVGDDEQSCEWNGMEWNGFAWALSRGILALVWRSKRMHLDFLGEPE